METTKNFRKSFIWLLCKFIIILTFSESGRLRLEKNPNFESGLLALQKKFQSSIRILQNTHNRQSNNNSISKFLKIFEVSYTLYGGWLVHFYSFEKINRALIRLSQNIYNGLSSKNSISKFLKISVLTPFHWVKILLLFLDYRQKMCFHSVIDTECIKIISELFD